MSSITRIVPSPRRKAARFLAGSLLCALALVGTSALAGAASSKASAAKISAHLTNTSFSNSQAGSVKLIYKLSATSRSFSYLLTFRKGSRWQKVKSVKLNGSFKGSHTMTVKKLLAGKPVKVGRYRLKLFADGGSKLLSFKVVKGKPVSTALPTISGLTAQGWTLSTSRGSWSDSPTSDTYRWRRCLGPGASCSDITGATGSSYTLVLADTGSTIRVMVTAINHHGATDATSRQMPVAVPSTTISAGGAHSCALLSGGTVKCWGYNGAGELGNGSTTHSSTPVSVSGITNVTQVSAGTWHTCALLSNHTVKCWGSNQDGKLGNGTEDDSSTPVSARGISAATQISAGESHSCALLSGGAVKCWGDNLYGLLGDGTETLNSSTPVSVSGISTATQISTGYSHACALLSGGTVECWGYNGYGQLGNGELADSTTPVSVVGLP